MALQHNRTNIRNHTFNMDFAPYQDNSPETERVLSPNRRSLSFSPPMRSTPKTTPKTSLNIPRTEPTAAWAASQAADLEAGGRRGSLDQFTTSLPIRLDYEACLAYLLLPPAGGALLLMLEHKSDYVRFHAWQSSLLFTAIFVLHLIFSWSISMSWALFLGDLGLIGYLTYRAYIDADMLDRCEVPFFGNLASKILDDE